jgi:RND family efflux transporter MFP subunit
MTLRKYMSSNEQTSLSSLQIDRSAKKISLSGKRPRKLWKYIVGGLLGVFILWMIVGALTAAPHVETTTATLMYPSDANRILIASGYVVAQRKAAVASKGTGRLVELNVVEGDIVKKNAVIARIESGDITAMLNQAKANLELSKASLASAQAEETDATVSFQRSKTLFASATIAKSEYDVSDARYKRALAAVRQAQAGIRANEAAVRSIEVQFENTVIRAPFDGTVLTKNADVGEVVAPFGAAANARGAVVLLADMSSLQVEADVSETNIQKIFENQPCEISIDAFPDARYHGFVDKIVPTADRAKATVLTKVRFTKIDGRVLPEMSAKVSFLSKAGAQSEELEKPKVVVNAAAVIVKDGISFVYVVKENTLSERRVTIGNSFDTMKEILSGVAAGEKVVLKPAMNFKDGKKIALGEK